MKLFPLNTLALFAVASLSSPAFSQATLSIDPVYEGGTATFHIDQGAANGVVVLCYSLAGTGPTTIPSGLTLDLSTPIGQLEALQLNANGHGELGPLPVPNSMSVGTQVWVQGVHINIWGLPSLELTNMVPVVVEQAPGPPRPDMVEIAGGTFEMGDHFNVGWSAEQPVHEVTLDTFYMDQYEVTNQKFADYLNSAFAQGMVTVSGGRVYQVGGSGNEICYLNNGLTWNGSSFQIDSGKTNHPAVYMTWYGACHYANWRSSEDNFTPCYDETTWDCDFQADGYRLPTEAEWEYAARGGAHNPYYQYPWNRNDINYGDANYDYTPNIGSTCDVGNYAPNGYGLYDTSGNVWEWCNDWYDSSYYSNSPNTNPTGPTTGSNRALRGGAWFNLDINLRSAGRGHNEPTSRNGSYGFRLLAVLP
ncbi:MAG: SUMF1/EgtB/PvdO family nonheme iron enzyme [Planctomycetota bacterium]|nr:SUMF1/EgtB/PvdO family nonheme iron enzyme [Planctomycetota bacterium]